MDMQLCIQLQIWEVHITSNYRLQSKYNCVLLQRGHLELDTPSWFLMEMFYEMTNIPLIQLRIQCNGERVETVVWA